MLTVIRPQKIVPFLIVFLNAALLSGAELSGSAIGLSFVFIVASCSFGMALNAWTDQELDRETKPQLYRSLAKAFSSHLGLMAVELLVSALCVAALAWSGRPASALWLVCFGVCFNLYSFNIFVPHLGARYRFKIFWWGNLLTAGGGYFSLWMSGLSCGWGPRAQVDHTPLVFVAALCSLLEYAVFLSECATDAAVERKSRLRTLPALLGRFGTVLLAWSACIGLLAAWFIFGSGLARAAPLPTSYLAVGTWYALSATAVCTGFLHVSRLAHSPRLWDQAVDFSFWLIRVGALVLILVTSGVAHA